MVKYFAKKNMIIKGLGDFKQGEISEADYLKMKKINPKILEMIEVIKTTLKNETVKK